MALNSPDKGNKILSASKQDYIILAEYELVAAENISGVYVIPSYKHSRLWFGVIFIQSGFYEGGIFRFYMILPRNFPDDESPPIIIFQNDIFHPLISPDSGIMNLKSEFPHWKKAHHHIWHILMFVKLAFSEPCRTVIKGGLANQRAADLLGIEHPQFFDRAKICAQKSKESLYDKPIIADRHYIVFEKPESETEITGDGELKMNILEQSSTSFLK